MRSNHHSNSLSLQATAISTDANINPMITNLVRRLVYRLESWFIRDTHCATCDKAYHHRDMNWGHGDTDFLCERCFELDCLIS
jgi:hypothetical protein